MNPDDQLVTGAEQAQVDVALTPEEEQELLDGQALAEMVGGAGFAVMKKWLEDRAFHTWADPRETESQAQWDWRELNAFHGAQAAKDLLDAINSSISRADYLYKVKKGELQKKTFRF
jgi:anaerobic ribonucleoside-triphosphate reductase